MSTIQSITIVTQTGAKEYVVGRKVQGQEIVRIVKNQLSITGDPYDHYIAYDERGEMIVTINCLTPCVIEYWNKK